MIIDALLLGGVLGASYAVCVFALLAVCRTR